MYWVKVCVSRCIGKEQSWEDVTTGWWEEALKSREQEHHGYEDKVHERRSERRHGWRQVVLRGLGGVSEALEGS